MSHHSSQSHIPDPERQRQLSAAMREIFGEHPAGKLNANDAGAIAMSIAQENGKVVMHFPKPVAWIGFTGDEAMEIAAVFMKHARAVGLTKPVTVII